MYTLNIPDIEFIVVLAFNFLEIWRERANFNLL